MGIDEYLIKHYGTEKGVLIYGKCKDIYESYNKFCIGESKARQKTMKTKILPRIALYQALMIFETKQKAYNMVWDYTKNYICANTRRKYSRLESIPLFFTLYRKIFLHIVSSSDKWETKVTKRESKKFGFEIHKCLWHDTCVRCGCPELCKIFCDSDWENFKDMNKTSFTRSQTIGTGGSLCDFLFEKVG